MEPIEYVSCIDLRLQCTYDTHLLTVVNQRIVENDTRLRGAVRESGPNRTSAQNPEIW